MNWLNLRATRDRINFWKLRFNFSTIVVVGLVGSIFFGLVSAVLPWWLVLVLMMMPLTLFLAWRYSEMAALLMVALQFGVLSAFTLKIPLAGGALLPEDIGIPLLLVILALKNSHDLRQRFSPLVPYVKTLGLLIICATVSAVISLGYGVAPIKDILNEARPYLSWLLFPLLCLAVDSDNKKQRFKMGIFFLAIIVAMGVIFQSLTGDTILGKGQAVRDVYTLGDSDEGVKRSDTSGNFLMVGVLVYIFYSFSQRHIRRPILLVVAGIILVAGIGVGFGRGLWLSTIFAIPVLFFYSKASVYFRFSVGILIIFIILAIGVSIFKPDYAASIENRFLSIVEEVESGSSFGRRTLENQYALQRIEASPLIGVGIGGQVKPRDSESRGWEGESRYIHNTYVGIAVKLGLPGLFIALILVWIILHRTFSATTRFSNDPALMFASFWIVVTTTLLTAATQPNLIASSGVTSITLAIFFSEAYRSENIGGNLINVEKTDLTKVRDA